MYKSKKNEAQEGLGKRGWGMELGKYTFSLIHVNKKHKSGWGNEFGEGIVEEHLSCNSYSKGKQTIDNNLRRT